MQNAGAVPQAVGILENVEQLALGLDRMQRDEDAPSHCAELCDAYESFDLEVLRESMRWP